MSDLFDSIIPLNPPREVMAEGAMLLRGAALPFETDILIAIQAITPVSPFRHMVTPGGFVMSVAMTNCGAAGWVTDRSGYRYDALDPESGKRGPRCRPASSISRLPQRRRRDIRTSYLTPA
jgi:DNA oxidative demethylase